MCWAVKAHISHLRFCIGPRDLLTSGHSAWGHHRCSIQWEHGVDLSLPRMIPVSPPREDLLPPSREDFFHAERTQILRVQLDVCAGHHESGHDSSDSLHSRESMAWKSTSSWGPGPSLGFPRAWCQLEGPTEGSQTMDSLAQLALVP